jgi:hypothetical protein
MMEQAMEHRLWKTISDGSLSDLVSLLNDFRLGVDLGLIEPVEPPEEETNDRP